MERSLLRAVLEFAGVVRHRREGDMSAESGAAMRSEEVAATGIQGLDDILQGGLTPNRLYLVEGVPGSGKTTLALQFLLEGVRRGEPVLYVTPSETETRSRRWRSRTAGRSSGVTIRELLPSERKLEPDEQYTMFHPSEVELTRHHQDDPGGRRAAEARARRARLALRAAAARRQSAALSPPDPRAEAVLRRPRAPCCCSTTYRDGARPAGAEHRARRDRARAADARSTAPSGAGCGSSSSAASRFAAAITTT